MNILFKAFLTSNEIELTELPELIQEKIDLFGKLHRILEEIEDSENPQDLDDQKEELQEQLQALDYEIIGDIESEFEDQLTNNDRQDQSTPKKANEPKNDISIIKELVKMGRTKNIGRHEFKEMGVQTRLGWKTHIGEFTVKRNSMIRYSYDIIGV